MILTGVDSDRTVPLADATAAARDRMSVAQMMARGALEEPARAMFDLAPYSYRQTLLADLSNSRRIALESSFDGIIDALQKASGVRLENPERGGYFDEADRRAIAQEQWESVDRNGFDARRAQARRDVFNEKVDELTRSRPEVADALAAARIDFDPAMIVRRAELEYEARARDKGLAVQLGAGLLGGLAASLRDPVQMQTLLLGGGPGTARTMLARLGQVAMRESALNAGIVALMQPEVQDWRNQVGLESGVMPALENIGMAAIFGGVFGGGIAGVGEVFRHVKGVAQLADLGDRQAVEAVLRGYASADETERALRALNIELTPEMRAELKTLRAADRADTATLPAAPEGVAPDAHVSALRDAVHRAENPVDAPPPEVPLPLGSVTTDDAARAAVADATGMDAVLVLRSDPRLVASALASADDNLRRAGQLATLPPEVLDRVQAGDLSPSLGAHIAAQTVDPAEQAQLAELVRKARPTSEDEARRIIADERGAVRAREAQAALLGRAETATDGALGPPQPHDPGSPEAKAQAEQAPALLKEPDLPEGEVPPPQTITDMLPMAGENGELRMLRRDQVLADIERSDLYGDLVASCTA